MKKTDKEYVEEYRTTRNPEILRTLVKKIYKPMLKTIEHYGVEDGYLVEEIMGDCICSLMEYLNDRTCEITTIRQLYLRKINREVIKTILRNNYVVCLDKSSAINFYRYLLKHGVTNKSIKEINEKYKISKQTIVQLYYILKNHIKPIDADVYFDEDDQEYYTKDELGSDDYEPSLMIQNSQIDKLYRRMVSFVNHSKQKGLDIEDFFEGNISLKDCASKLGITVGAVFNRYKKGVTRFLSERNIDIYNYI